MALRFNTVFYVLVLFTTILSVRSLPADDEGDGPLNVGSSTPGGEPPKPAATEPTTNRTNPENVTSTTSQSTNDSSSTSVRPETPSTTSVETSSETPKVPTAGPNVTAETTTNTTPAGSSSNYIFATTILVFLPAISVLV